MPSRREALANRMLVHITSHPTEPGLGFYLSSRIPSFQKTEKVGR
jgi:hypothetical protein